MIKVFCEYQRYPSQNVGVGGTRLADGYPFSALFVFLQSIVNSTMFIVANNPDRLVNGLAETSGSFSDGLKVQLT